MSVWSVSVSTPASVRFSSPAGSGFTPALVRSSSPAESGFPPVSIRSVSFTSHCAQTPTAIASCRQIHRQVRLRCSLHSPNQAKRCLLPLKSLSPTFPPTPPISPQRPFGTRSQTLTQSSKLHKNTASPSIQDKCNRRPRNCQPRTTPATPNPYRLRPRHLSPKDRSSLGGSHEHSLLTRPRRKSGKASNRPTSVRWSFLVSFLLLALSVTPSNLLQRCYRPSLNGETFVASPEITTPSPWEGSTLLYWISEGDSYINLDWKHHPPSSSPPRVTSSPKRQGGKCAFHLNSDAPAGGLRPLSGDAPMMEATPISAGNPNLKNPTESSLGPLFWACFGWWA